MKKDNTLLVLITAVALLFSVIGIVMVFYDTRYWQGSLYLMTALVFSIAVYRLHLKKSEIDQIAYMGFIFAVIGLSINVGVWALGIILFSKGLVKR